MEPLSRRCGPLVLGTLSRSEAEGPGSIWAHPGEADKEAEGGDGGRKGEEAGGAHPLDPPGSS